MRVVTVSAVHRGISIRGLARIPQKSAKIGKLKGAFGAAMEQLEEQSLCFGPLVQLDIVAISAAAVPKPSQNSMVLSPSIFRALSTIGSIVSTALKN